MTAGAPALCDDIVVRVDVIAIGRFFLVLRDRRTRQPHSFIYDAPIRLGSSASGDCYELTLPRWLAIASGMEGIADAV